MKLLKKTILSDIQLIPDEDIALLALMCNKCSIITFRKIFLQTKYFYYVPQSESYLDIAKDIFNKNGINMEVHFSHIIDYEGRNVLRINYENCINNHNLYTNMSRIHNQSIALFEKKTHSKRQLLLNKIKTIQR